MDLIYNRNPHGTFWSNLTQVTELEVKVFFESLCGEVHKVFTWHILAYLAFESFLDHIYL